VAATASLGLFARRRDHVLVLANFHRHLFDLLGGSSPAKLHLVREELTSELSLWYYPAATPAIGKPTRQLEN
jgi:hypothetical protein